MKILLISNYRPDKQQSMLRYAEMVRQELDNQGHEVEVVYPPVVLGRFSLFPNLLQKWIGYIDKYLFAPAYLRKKARDADIVHICDHSNAMYLSCAGAKPTVITCHDLLAIFAARGTYSEIRVGLTGRILQNWIATNLSRAKHIVCVSAKTQGDLESLAPGIRSRTTVIHHHLNWDYSPANADAVNEVKSKAGLSPTDEYLLHVGGNQWYKNRLGAMRIFSALRKYPCFQQTTLIMAGKPWTAEMRRYCESSGLVNHVIERTEVSNNELRALYSGATALLFPSIEEGFGWPVLEAQACGCPIITSNRAPMTEIAGDAAIFIDPSDPERAAEVIAEHTADLTSLRAAGFRNLDRFVKDSTISRYSKFYRHVIDSEMAVTANKA